MAFDVTTRPQTVEEMRDFVSSAIVATGRARQSLTSNAPYLAAMVSHLYSYMDIPDLHAKAKGGEILREAEKIDAAVADILRTLGIIRRKTDAAIAAFRDHETKLRTERAKIG